LQRVRPSRSVGVIGHTDPARLSDAFEAGSNVDPIPKNIIVVDNDIADVNADAKF
jgi:hypothetical protein